MPRPVAIGLASAAVVLLVAVAVVVLTRATPEEAAPEITAPAELRAVVGERLEHRFEVVDGTGDEALRWSAEGLPAGARLTPDGLLTWSPDPSQAGTWDAAVTAVDGDGRPATKRVALLGRHRPRPRLYVALGDSAASGHGLDWRAYLGRDRCWRHGTASYPARLLERAIGRGASVRRLALLACSGHDARDLLDRPVGGPDLGDGVRQRAQIEWAIVTNPGLVTITIGANDLGFGTPERAVDAEGELDERYLDARVDRVRSNLARALRRLVAATDARVLITTYHNPTAERPHGVRGCRERCFKQITDEVVSRLNDRITEIAARFPADRVAVAEVTDAFAGRGAPNGRGLDALRGWDAPSWVPTPLTWTSGIHAYCAKGRPAGPASYVSSVDCVHPNAAGARAYADVVVEAWAATGWRGAPTRE